MKWGDVIITTPQGRKRGEGARSWFANAYPTRIAGTKLKHSVALKKADSTTTVNNDELKLIFRSLLNNNVAFGDEPAPVLPQVANAHRGNAPNVIVRPAPELLMYMNGLRRLPADADPLIDDVPTRNQNWEWGVNRLGAILTVKTRVYQNGAEVKERSLLRIVWRNDYAANWQATLAVDHAGRIRIFRTKLEGGALLLGDTEAGPLLLHNDVTLSQALQAQQSCDLWMEAIDFPETATEADWLVTLTLTFQLNAVNTNQSAVQRIAPWIMGSDLDETFRFYVRTTAGAPDDLSTAVLNFGATAFPIDAGQPKKGYARDVMKSGYSAGPHYSSVVVQGRLDDIAALQLLANTAAQDATGGVIVKPRNRGDLSGQDNGGNLLVSPPTDAYPWGRILFGGTDAMPCQSGAFYTAQKVQRPIRLNSTWLRVGHVDEMLSIVRRNNGSYAALLLSPRLGFIMLKGVACRNDADATTLVAWANGVNDGLRANAYDRNAVVGELNNLNPVAMPNPYMRFEPVAVTGDDPAVPANSDRFVVLRAKDSLLAQFFRGAPLAGGVVQQYGQAFPDGRESFELWVHSRRFLDRGQGILLDTLDLSQAILDDVRTTLINDLGFQDGDIIEVPALLNIETGACVAMTGDSVNLLQKVGGALQASQCLVPKPFGPVYAGEYVFENHLQTQFNALGIQAQYCADDRYHLDEGELHCATNQTHPALTGDLQKWYEWVAP